MPISSKKQPPKRLRKIVLKKASGSQILSGMKITKIEHRDAEKAIASALQLKKAAKAI